MKCPFPKCSEFGFTQSTVTKISLFKIIPCDSLNSAKFVKLLRCMLLSESNENNPIKQPTHEKWSAWPTCKTFVLYFPEGEGRGGWHRPARRACARHIWPRRLTLFVVLFFAVCANIRRRYDRFRHKTTVRDCTRTANGHERVRVGFPLDQGVHYKAALIGCTVLIVRIGSKPKSAY